MIYYVSTHRFASTVRHLIGGLAGGIRGILRSLTYEELFFERAGPIGHYIFTDIDRLSRFELETAARFVTALHCASPEARVLNHPLCALDRLPLLVALHQAGINDFTANRIDTGERPKDYPVFIRAEDGYGGPETDLIHSETAYEAALAELKRQDLPLRGRIAVGYAAEQDADGYFRKYGAFIIGDRIIPQHIIRDRFWVVKRNLADHSWAKHRTSEAGSDDVWQEELDFVRTNPHCEVLRAACRIGRMDFGRIDYGIVRGRVQIYEINTNPRFPGFAKSTDRRSERRSLIRRQFLDALNAVNLPLAQRGRVRFSEARPRAHDLHVPRQRLPISLTRRLSDRLFGLRRFSPRV